MLKQAPLCRGLNAAARTIEAIRHSISQLLHAFNSTGLSHRQPESRATNAHERGSASAMTDARVCAL